MTKVRKWTTPFTSSPSV